MSATTESLLFKVNVMRSGMTTEQITQLNTALKSLSTVKPGAGGNLFAGIINDLKGAGAAADQLSGKTKTLDSNLKNTANAAKILKSATIDLGTSTNTMSVSFDRAKGSAATLLAGLRPIDSQLKQTGASAQSSGNLISNAFAAARTSLNMYTSEGTKVVTTNAAITSSTTAASAAVDRIRLAYTNAMAGQQQYATSSTGAAGANQRFTATSASLTDTLNRQNQAIAQTTANVNKLTQAQSQSQQQTMSIVRGMSTMFMGFMMLNQSMTDFRINQESMADLQTSLTEKQERYNQMVERFGEGSYMAQQALGALQKAQRAIRYEQREMNNQIQNQIFLMAMIGQNILSDAIPALLNLGETSKKVRGIMDGLHTRFTTLGGGIKTFVTSLLGITPAAQTVANSFGVVDGAVGTFNRNAATAGNAGRTLSSGISTIGPAATGAASSMGALPAVISRTDTVSRTVLPSLETMRTGMVNLANTSSTILPGLGAGFGTLAAQTTVSARAFGDVERAMVGANGQFRGIGVAVGQTTPGLTKMGDTVHVLGTKMDTLEKSGSRASRAAESLRGGFSRLTGVIGTGAGGAGLIGGMIAAGVGLALYSSNAGGARDMTHSFGETVGKMHPLLQAAGQGLTGIAGAMGLTGESATSVNHHFKEAGKAFQGFTEDWHNAVDTMQRDTNIAVSAIGDQLRLLTDMLDSLGKAATGTPEIDTSLPKEEAIAKYQQKAENLKNNPFIPYSALFPVPSDEDAGRLYDEQKERDTRKQREQEMLRQQWEDRSRVDYGADIFTKPIPTAGGGSTQITDPLREAYLEKLKEAVPLYKTLTDETGQYTQELIDMGEGHRNATIQGEIARAGKLGMLAALGDEYIGLQKTAQGLKMYSELLDEPTIKQAEIARGTIEQVDKYLQLRTALLNNQGVMKEWIRQQGDTKYAQDMVTAGAQSQIMKYLEMRDTILTNQGVMQQWTKHQSDAFYQQDMVTAGIQEQQMKYLELKDSILSNVGVIQEYNRQLTDQQFINDQVTAGYQAQQIAFNDQQVAIANNIGALAAYGEAYESGRLQQMSFLEGMIAQEQKFFDTVMAAEQAKGSYERLGEQMARGTIQQAAFEKGFAETQYAIRQQTVDLEEAKGGINAYVEGLQSGVVEQNAMTQGIIDQREALINSIVELHRSNSALEEFKLQLSTGVPQAVAYGQTMVDLGMAAKQQSIEFAEARATMDFNQQALAKYLDTTNKGKVDLNSFNDVATGLFNTFDTKAAVAFTKGQNAVSEWIFSLQDAAHEQAGFTTSLQNVADYLGILPAGFTGGTEALQEMIGLFVQAPSVIGAAVDKLKGIFDGMVTGLADSLREGKKEFKGAVKELEESLGIDFNKGVKNALKIEASGELFGQLSNEFSALFIGLGDNLDPESFNDLKDDVTDRLDEVFDGLPDSTKPRVQESMKNIMKIFNETTAEDMQSPTGIKNFISSLGIELINLTDATNGFGKIMNDTMAAIARGDLNTANQLIKNMNMNMETMNGIRFDPVVGEFIRIQGAAQMTKEEVDDLAEALSDVREKYIGTKDIKGASEELSEAGSETAVYGTDKEGTLTSITDVGKLQDAVDSQGKPIPFDQLLKQNKAKMEEAGGGGGKDAAGIAAIVKMANEATKAIALLQVQVQNVLTAIQANFATAFAGMLATVTQYVGLMSTKISEQVTIWNTTIASVAVGFVQQFSIGTTGAAKAIDLLSQFLSGQVTIWNTSISSIAVGLVTQFSIGTTGAATAIDLLSQFISGQVTIWNTTFASVGVGIAQQITIGVQGAGQQIQLLSDFIASTVGVIAINLQGISNVALTVFTTLANAGIKAFSIVLEAATSVAVSISKGYHLLANAIVGYFAGMATRSATSFTRITTSANNTANSINRAMNQAVNAAIGYISQLSTKSASAFQSMANNASKVADAVKSIGDAASSAASQVQSLASALENIPEQVNTTINVGLAGPGAAYLQGGTSGQIYFEEGGNAYFANGEGGLGDRKKNRRRAIVGETNDEKVIRTGLRTGNVREETVTHMRTLSDLGLHEPELLQVIPTKGHYAQRFKERAALGKMGSGIMGGLAKILTRAGIDVSNIFGGNNDKIPMFAFGVSTGASPNTASGPIITSPDGNIYTWEDGGTPYSRNEWNDMSDGDRQFHAESDDIGIKSLPDGSFLEEDYTVTMRGGSRNEYINNRTWRSGPNAGEKSDAYDSQGRPTYKYGNGPAGGGGGGGSGGGTTPPPGGGTGGGGGGGMNPNGPPTMTNPKDNDLSEGSYLGSGEGEYYNVGSGYYVPTYAQSMNHGATDPSKWNNANWDPKTWKAVRMTSPDFKGLWKVVDDKGINIIAKLKSKEEAEEFIREHLAGVVSPPPGGGTGGGGGGGGSGGGSGGSITKLPNQPYQHSETAANPSDSGIVEMKDSDDMTVAQWNALPESERRSRTSQIHSMPRNYDLYSDYKMYPDGTNPNTGGGGGGTTPPPGGGTGGGGEGTFEWNRDDRRDEDEGYVQHPKTGYYSPSYIQTTGGPKWDNPNLDPNTWKVVPMENNPNKFKVVDDKGVNIAANFNRQEGAQEFIDDHKRAYRPPTGGGGGTTPPPTGGTPPPTGGGTPPPTGGGGGNVPQPGQSSGTGPKWQGANQDKNTWRVVPMTDPDKQGKWKVVDDKGINIAAMFNSREDAELWLAHQKGQTTPPPTGGGGGGTTPPPTGGTPPPTGGTPPPTGGGGGNTGTPTQVVTGGNVRIEQYPNGQKIFIDGKLVLDTTGGGGTTPPPPGGTTPPPAGGGTPMGNAWLAGAAGISYNHRTSTHPGLTNVGGGTGGGGGGTTPPPTGGGGGNLGTVEGYNGNFNYQVNGRRLRIENGRVVENTLTEADMVGARASFKTATGKDLVIVGGGTTTPPPSGTTPPPATGGTTTPPPTTGTTNTQTQTVNQTSSINGQANNSNSDTMVGTNNRLRIQNGRVVEATGIFANQAGTGNTGGTGGVGSGTGTGAANGQIRDTIFKSMAMMGGLSPYLQTGIPSSPFPDSVNAMIDNQADPLFRQFSGSLNDHIPGGPPTGGTPPPGTTPPPPTPGTGGYFDWIKTLLQAINRMIYGMTDKLKVNVTNQVNDKTFWRITNDQLIQSMKRY